MYNINHNN